MAVKRAGGRAWFDPRFAIGLALIVAAVAGTVAVVAAADSSVEVLSARSALTPGQTVTTADLIVSHVSVEHADSLYLQSGDVAGGAVVITRTVAAGELVPVSAVGTAQGIDATTVVVTLDGQLPAAVVAGSVADLWSASKLEGGGFGAPAVLVPGATVVRLVKPEGLVVDDSAASVEVLVPRDNVARLLEATANKASLSLLPTSLPVGR